MIYIFFESGGRWGCDFCMKMSTKHCKYRCFLHLMALKPRRNAIFCILFCNDARKTLAGTKKNPASTQDISGLCIPIGNLCFFFCACAGFMSTSPWSPKEITGNGRKVVLCQVAVPIKSSQIVLVTVSSSIVMISDIYIYIYLGKL